MEEKIEGDNIDLEGSREEIPVEPEKETPPENLEQVLETQSEQAKQEVEGLKQEGQDLGDVLKKNKAEEGDIEEFKEGKKGIDNNADEAKEEYENSFRTPGDIESYIRSQGGEGSEDGAKEFKKGQEKIGGEAENTEKTNINSFITEENEDNIEHIKKGLESIEELDNADEKRKKLREMAGKILELSGEKSDAFKNSDMKELVALMNSISDKIDNESSIGTTTVEKPQLEKTEIKNSAEINVEKTKEFSDKGFIQSYYDDFRARIKEIVESDQSYSKKFDAIDELSDELREQIDFIRKDILETDEAKKILGSLEGEFSKAKKDIKESISEKGLREEVNDSIQNSVKTVENGLKGLELSKENASGKISGIKGISSFFELTVKIYKKIIDNDETLRSIVNDKREMIKTAMRKLGEEPKQSIDVEAEKSPSEESEDSFRTPGDIESGIGIQRDEGDEGGIREENKGDLAGKE